LVGGLGGLGLLVSSVLPWYSSGLHDLTAWQAFSATDLVLAAAAILALSVAACVLFGISVSYPVAGSSVATGFGAVAVVLIVIRMISPPGDQLDLDYGAWLGLLSAAAVTLGGYLGMQPMKARNTVSAA
jgi:hypothetical protein